MVSSYLENDILILNLNKKINQILKENEINSIEDLWIKNRANLKKMGLNDKEIKEVIIKLELIGLDLNKKKNK